MFLKILGIALLALIVASAGLVYLTGPKLPADADAIIDDVLRSDLPELVKGQSGYVTSDGYQIWYESIPPQGADKGTILLFSGSATDALMWPQAFIDGFVNSGYRVVRFDYRGVGESDWVQDWRERPYSVTDLAGDAKAILDELGIDRVHAVGMSLGGMVAEEFALQYPDRTLTLTTLMSSGDIYDPELPQVSAGVVFDFTKIGIKYGLFPSEKNTIKMMLGAQAILRGDANYDLDVQGTAERVLYNLRERKGFNPDASKQHDQATRLWGTHYDQLKRLPIPTLIIHGKNDPFVSIEHSRKLASVIPGAKVKWFDDMGHDLPPNLIDAIVEEIVQHIGTG